VRERVCASVRESVCVRERESVLSMGFITWQVSRVAMTAMEGVSSPRT
jgi:hypothetical protein